ncbi:MAG: hypothetical protein ACRD0K_22920 [Egibacteraceae bacterium]
MAGEPNLGDDVGLRATNARLRRVIARQDVQLRAVAEQITALIQRITELKDRPAQSQPEPSRRSRIVDEFVGHERWRACARISHCGVPS